MPDDTERALRPEPALCDDVFDPEPVEVPYSNHQVVERPFGVTAPRRVAEVGAIAVASPVATVGAELVVNVASLPVVVPASLVATMRKWYVRPATRPLIPAETGCALVAEPALFELVFVP